MAAASGMASLAAMSTYTVRTCGDETAASTAFQERRPRSEGVPVIGEGDAANPTVTATAAAVATAGRTRRPRPRAPAPMLRAKASATATQAGTARAPIHTTR